MQQAGADHRRSDSLEGHRIWIETLLSDYYDPMYSYQMEKKADRIRIRAPRDELVAWYAEHQGELK